MASILSLLTFGLIATNSALGHPGHDVQAEANERAQYLQTHNPKSVRSCANTLRRRGHLDAAISRRQALANQLRARHSISQRAVPEYNISHASSLDVTLGSDETLLFADDSSCTLQPEATIGPYYIDGELIRRNIGEDQAGIPLYLDVQLVNVATCEPVPAVFVDAWHANATGVYSGIVNSGNGNGNDTANWATTFGRGIQQTDSNGVVQFETIYPGHYTGRAHHIHVLSHPAASTTIRTNGTLLGPNATLTHASHVGQVYFDQDLSARVEATEPYNLNQQSLTTNAADKILAADIENSDSDPFVEYVLVDEQDVTKGVLAWISLGIEVEQDRECESAATLYEEGGEKNEEFKYKYENGQGVRCA